MTTFPCPASVSSHHYHVWVTCYGLNICNGRPFALIEHEGGEVVVQWLDGVYSIKLNDARTW